MVNSSKVTALVNAIKALITAHNGDSSAHNLNKSLNVAQANVAGTTSAYTATATGVTLTHGTLLLLYNNVGANVASATLDVNGLGAKPLYNQSTAITKSRWPANTTVLVMYNTTLVANGCWQIIYSYGANSTYTAASASPVADGASAVVGSSSKYAREDHVHPKSALYAEASHTHSGYANSSHNHNIGDLNNVQAVSVTVTYTNNTSETIKLLKYTGS